MRKRICLATDSRDPSGVGEHMLMLAAALRDRYDIVLACADSPGGRSLLARAARSGLAIMRLDEHDDPTRRWLARSGFHLLHVHAGIGWEGHGLAALGRAAGIPGIVRTEHLPDLITDPLQRQCHSAGIRLVDAVICVSQAAANSFVEASSDPAKLHVIRNGVAPGSPALDPAVTRRSLGAAPRHRILLTVARFTSQKDHRTLVEALPAVLAASPDTRVWLAGMGPLEAEVRAQASALGVADAVTFLGFRDDVPDLMAAADCFVLPSRFEGLPLAALEAMAACLPVVATRVGGTDEVVRDGLSGRLVEAGDAAALSDAICDVIGNKERARAFGIAGRARFEAEFTVTRMAEATAQLYSRLDETVRPSLRTIMDDGASARTRLGFIGAGGIAQRHLGVLEGFEDVAIVAFSDPVEERARDTAQRFGARAYTDFEAMLNEQRLDALYICVPPFAHGAPERAALAHRLPFFVEKPVGIDLAAAEVIGSAVEEAGLVTAAGYHWRYLDTVEEAAALLAESPAHLLSGSWLDSTPPPQWWWKQDRSGGQINEQTTHIVDLARYLVGDVTQVFGLAAHRAREDFPGLDVATASTITLKFASGAIGTIGSTCLLGWNHRVGLHIFGDRMALELTDHDIMIDVGHGRPYRAAEGDPVWREDRDFIDAVRGGENRIRCPYAEALKTLRVTDAIRRSIDTGRAVDLPHQTAEASHV